MTDTSELKTFTENLLDGETLDNDFFLELANVVRVKIEAIKDWIILRDEDATQTASVGDTFLTMKDLPARFAKMLELFTAKSDGVGQQFYKPVKFEKRYAYRLSSKRYYIDLKNSQFALCGVIGAARTIHQVYKRDSAPISDSQAWEFPTRFMLLIGFGIAVIHKAGVDYDTINIAQALQNREDSKELLEALIEWDTDLALSEMDYQSEGVGATDADGLPSSDDEFDLGSL